MKNRMALIIIAILTFVKSVDAQDFNPQYSGHFNVGVLYGSNKTRVQIETIHGIEFDRWFAGIGAAIDDYYQQSIPAFIDVRGAIFKRKKTPFVYAEAGANILNKGTETEYSKTEYKSGLFCEGGLGYKIDLANKTTLNFACGFSYKDHVENLYYKMYYGPAPYYHPIPEGEWSRRNHNKYTLQRIVMKIGIQF